MITALLAMLLIASALAWTALSTHRRPSPSDRQPSNVERIAQWERRMGEWRAAERLRQHSAAQAFDARASVQPYITPRLP